jgi:hypothetical protein
VDFRRTRSVSHGGKASIQVAENPLRGGFGVIRNGPPIFFWPEVCASLIGLPAVERCPSGLRSTLGKRVSGKLDRGFESHPLRHFHYFRVFTVYGVYHGVCFDPWPLHLPAKEGTRHVQTRQWLRRLPPETIFTFTLAGPLRINAKVLPKELLKLPDTVNSPHLYRDYPMASSAIELQSST